MKLREIFLQCPDELYAFSYWAMRGDRKWTRAAQWRLIYKEIFILLGCSGWPLITQVNKYGIFARGSLGSFVGSHGSSGWEMVVLILCTSHVTLGIHHALPFGMFTSLISHQRSAYSPISKQVLLVQYTQVNMQISWTDQNSESTLYLEILMLALWAKFGYTE